MGPLRKLPSVDEKKRIDVLRGPILKTNNVVDFFRI
jgi:hypothetical protein